MSEWSDPDFGMTTNKNSANSYLASFQKTSTSSTGGLPPKGEQALIGLVTKVVTETLKDMFPELEAQASDRIHSETVSCDGPIGLICALLRFQSGWPEGVLDLTVQVCTPDLAAKAMFSLVESGLALSLVSELRSTQVDRKGLRLKLKTRDGSLLGEWKLLPAELMWFEMRPSGPQSPLMGKARFRRNEMASSRGLTLTLESKDHEETICLLDTITSLTLKGRVVGGKGSNSQ
jgi:hypothetical protein